MQARPDAGACRYVIPCREHPRPNPPAEPHGRRIYRGADLMRLMCQPTSDPYAMRRRRVRDATSATRRRQVGTRRRRVTDASTTGQDAPPYETGRRRRAEPIPANPYRRERGRPVSASGRHPSPCPAATPAAAAAYVSDCCRTSSTSRTPTTSRHAIRRPSRADEPAQQPELVEPAEESERADDRLLPRRRNVGSEQGDHGDRDHQTTRQQSPLEEPHPTRRPPLLELTHSRPPIAHTYASRPTGRRRRRAHTLAFRSDGADRRRAPGRRARPGARRAAAFARPDRSQLRHYDGTPLALRRRPLGSDRKQGMDQGGSPSPGNPDRPRSGAP